MGADLRAVIHGVPEVHELGAGGGTVGVVDCRLGVAADGLRVCLDGAREVAFPASQHEAGSVRKTQGNMQTHRQAKHEVRGTHHLETA